ncbi:SapC family protein [Glaciecola sp. MH2013]|uniref:SapC family protein n=1 Tax=Glaciecola sp. MH2013 TaxID=2785524 RepID=UPI0018A00C83|nr:SapC family protein [Glaciecola sp. MH2013]MBF7074216.1 SapC family protein [Glaciecola sp. MH2013]
MTKLTLVELSSTAHKDLKIKNSANIDHIAKQHLMNLRATELGQAATCYPVFATKNSHNGFWTFSAMTSFAPDNNLFVKDGKLDAIYRPTSVQSFPFYLMRSPKDENAYTIGILEDQGDFSKSSGEALFDEEGKPTAATSNRIQILDADVHKDVQTAKFSQTLEKMGLFKALDMNVQYLAGDSSKIRGLHTIDEDRFQALSVEELDSLRKEGYLMPIHAMLISILQVNKLINLNNEVVERPQIVEVKMEVAKDAAIS